MKNKKQKAQKLEAGSKEQEARQKAGLPHFLSIILIIIISIAIYSNTLKNGFVYDDEVTIVNNTLIKDFGNISKLFTKEYFSTSAEMSYRPVVTLTYFIDYWLYGIKPFGYHLTNLILHAINGVILYIFLTLLFKPVQDSRFNLFSPSLLIALLFVAHPVLTEAVNAISFREDLLCFLFFISALIIYIIQNSKFKTQDSKLKTFSLQLLALSLYLLALLSKEMAITFPLIIYLYEWLYKSPLTKGAEEFPLNKGGLRGLLLNRYTIGYIVITCFYLYLRFFLFHKPVEENIYIWLLSERLMTIPYIILKYLLLLITPVSLSADYAIAPVQSLISLNFIIPLFIILLLIIVSLFFNLQSSNFNLQSVFGILFFLITLLPVYNIIPIVNPFAERYLYLPMVGFAIVIGSTFILLISWLSPACATADRSHRSLLIAHCSLLIAHCSLLIILCIYSFVVIQRNKIWADSYSLWSDTVRKTPDSSRSHNALGNAYDTRGQIDEAIKEYKLALTLKSDFAEAHNNLGSVYEKQGQIDEAIKEYRMAIEISPSLAMPYNNLGNIYIRQEKLDEAIKEYLTALRLKPDYANAYYNLGNIYHKQGRLDDAIKEYLKAIKLKPEFAMSYRNLGLTYIKQNRLDEAINEFLTALKLAPNDVIAHYNLALAYNIKGLNEKAIEKLEIALRLKPDYTPARKALESLRKK